MEVQEFFARLEQSIARYDLLRHPFYEAWSRGDLTLKDLQQYALDYYHHVESFPRCLAQFARRLEKSELREAVLRNLSDEMGGDTRRSHADLSPGAGVSRFLCLRVAGVTRVPGEVARPHREVRSHRSYLWLFHPPHHGRPVSLVGLESSAGEASPIESRENGGDSQGWGSCSAPSLGGARRYRKCVS